MEQMIAQEFCRQTKLHMDEILSAQHFQIDVSKLIEVMQSTIEFETDLQSKFDSNNFSSLDDFEPQIKIGAQVQIEAGSAKEIAAKYKNENQPKKVAEGPKKVRNVRNHYRFTKCISEVFEPYLKSYSESEEKKINETMEQVVGPNDKLEQIDYIIYSSSLRLFKNIKDSMRRCTSFSTSKALFDL